MVVGGETKCPDKWVGKIPINECPDKRGFTVYGNNLQLKFASTNEIPITLSAPKVNLEDFEEQECY